MTGIGPSGGDACAAPPPGGASFPSVSGGRSAGSTVAVVITENGPSSGYGLAIRAPFFDHWSCTAAASSFATFLSLPGGEVDLPRTTWAVIGRMTATTSPAPLSQ